MILLRLGINSSLGRSQSIGNGLTSFMSSLSVTPLSFSTDQLDVHRVVDTRRRLSNVEQISDRSSGSSLSLSMTTSRLDCRRHSTSPEPLIQRLSSFGSEAKVGSNYDNHQFVEEEGASYNLPSKHKTNGHLSQDNYLDQPRFLSMSTFADRAPSQPTSLSYQHRHGNDNTDGSKLTFKKKDIRKFAASNNLFTQNGNVQLLSSNKLSSLDKGLDVRWEVRR